jgi:formyl-CoA transferase
MASHPSFAAGLHRKSFDPAARGMLDGVRVIDLSRLVAGNLLTLTLADHGAEVVKIEPPAGDSLRAWKVKGVETAWKTWCRNKRSVCLDLRNPEAVAVVRRLAQDAAIFVESFRPGVLEEMGLSPAALLAANPRLVIVRVSGWGQDGPYRHKPGFGTLVEGYSGFASVNGFADREPVLPPMFMADAYAGLYGSTATMMALRHAEATGEGQVIDLSLFEPIFAILEPQMANYRTKDGKWVGLSSSTQSVFERLMRSIGQEALLADPRFATNSDRLRNIEAIDGVIRDAVATMTLAEALAQFDRDGVTIGPILDVGDLATDAYVREREALVAVPDAEMPGGLLPMHGQVPRLSRTPGALRCPAPRLGQDTRDILAGTLGAAEADRLITQGVAIGAKE